MNRSTHRAVVHQVFLAVPASEQDHLRHQNALFLSPPPPKRSSTANGELRIISPSLRLQKQIQQTRWA